MTQSTVQLPDYAVHHPTAAAANGASIFLLHGAFGAKEYWREQVRAFTGAGYRVVSWDAPGYGLSALPQPLTIDHCARTLALLLEREGGARNIIIGLSMGGMIAQQAWRHARGHIHGYVMSATSASFGNVDGEWQKGFVRERVAPLDAGKTIPEYAPLMLRSMMAPGARGPAVDLVIDTVSQMREETFRAAIAAIVGFEGRDLLPTLNVPVLCIAGALDATAPASVMEKMASKIVGAEFVSLSGLAHFGWAEDPLAFNAKVLDFLSRRFLSLDGFTFICGKSRRGAFLLHRKTRGDRMRAKLQEIKVQLRGRMHDTIPEQGRWLKAVVTGYFAYHAVHTNSRALRAFRYHVTELWRRTLRRAVRMTV